MSEDANSINEQTKNALISRCTAIYKHLAKKLPRSARIPPPAVGILDQNIYSHHDGIALLLHPSLAHLPEKEQCVEFSRIAGYYLQYHRNPRIKFLLNANELSQPEGLQMHLFSEIALTYASFLGLLKHYDARSIATIANEMHQGARQQPVQCTHSAGAWYGSGIFLRHGHTVLDKVITMTSARDINTLRVAHLEGYEQTLSELRKVRGTKSDGNQ